MSKFVLPSASISKEAEEVDIAALLDELECYWAKLEKEVDALLEKRAAQDNAKASEKR